MNSTFVQSYSCTKLVMVKSTCAPQEGAEAREQSTILEIENNIILLNRFSVFYAV